MCWDINDQPKAILCRPALPMDTPDVIELTSHIWEGEDYIPHVWHQWLADPDGLLAVVETGGRVIGLGKLTKLSDFEWWLEGLRVHPDFEGRGIASQMNEYMLQYWYRCGAGVIRLATGSHREPVKHLSEKAGFKIVAEYTFYKSGTIHQKAVSPGKLSFIQLTSEEVDTATQYLLSSSREVLPFGLVNIGWQFGSPISAHIENLLKDGKAWWWQQRKGLLFLEEKEEDSESIARILTLACQIGDLGSCLIDIEILAAQMGFGQISWLAPMLPEIEAHLLKAGYERDWESSLLIYKKPHPQS